MRSPPIIGTVNARSSITDRTSNVLLDDFSNRLIADADFCHYVKTTYQLVEKVYSSGSFQLCSDYFAKKISAENLTKLKKNMGVKTEAEIISFFKSYLFEASAVLKKFPDLVKNEQSAREAVIEVMKKQKLSPSFYPATDCWALLGSGSSSCYFACGGDDGCFDDCIMALLEAVFICYALSGN